MAFTLCLQREFPIDGLFDEDFGLLGFPDVRKRPKIPTSRVIPYKILPPFCHRRSEKDKDLVVKGDSETFRVKINVSGFSPEELNIKISDNVLLVEGKHEETMGNDGGFVSNRFLRKVCLPGDVELELLASSLDSENGLLTVSAPKKLQDKLAERKIPIIVEKKKEEIEEHAGRKSESGDTQNIVIE